MTYVLLSLPPSTLLPAVPLAVTPAASPLFRAWHLQAFGVVRPAVEGDVEKPKELKGKVGEGSQQRRRKSSQRGKSKNVNQLSPVLPPPSDMMRDASFGPVKWGGRW